MACILSSEYRSTCMCIKAQWCDTHTPPLSPSFSVPQRNSGRRIWIRSEFRCKAMQLLWHLSFVLCHWRAITLLSCLTELPLQPIYCRREHLAPYGSENENIFPGTIINCTEVHLRFTWTARVFQGKCQWSKVNVNNPFLFFFLFFLLFLIVLHLVLTSSVVLKLSSWSVVVCAHSWRSNFAVPVRTELLGMQSSWTGNMFILSGKIVMQEKLMASHWTLSAEINHRGYQRWWSFTLKFSTNFEFISYRTCFEFFHSFSYSLKK